ncbi:hypothetical protein Rhopal_000675-T1 [Rhodotorula paludigena]|uniref:Uncharacterized protein n=1 Tax=Rhodotorula paludigena TaxID=86838 RepID=A0AAV5GDJ0_9BASI|nr:hypothetical protein Rhopal_000675-T1 [Rhodotorula paludigena]
MTPTDGQLEAWICEFLGYFDRSAAWTDVVPGADKPWEGAIQLPSHGHRGYRANIPIFVHDAFIIRSLPHGHSIVPCKTLPIHPRGLVVSVPSRVNSAFHMHWTFLDYIRDPSSGYAVATEWQIIDSADSPQPRQVCKVRFLADKNPSSFVGYQGFVHAKATKPSPLPYTIRPSTRTPPEAAAASSVSNDGDNAVATDRSDSPTATLSSDPAAPPEAAWQPVPHEKSPPSHAGPSEGSHNRRELVRHFAHHADVAPAYDPAIHRPSELPQYGHTVQPSASIDLSLLDMRVERFLELRMKNETGYRGIEPDGQVFDILACDWIAAASEPGSPEIVPTLSATIAVNGRWRPFVRKEWRDHKLVLLDQPRLYGFGLPGCVLLDRIDVDGTTDAQEHGSKRQQPFEVATTTRRGSKIKDEWRIAGFDGPESLPHHDTRSVTSIQWFVSSRRGQPSMHIRFVYRNPHNPGARRSEETGAGERVLPRSRQRAKREDDLVCVSFGSTALEVEYTPQTV